MRRIASIGFTSSPIRCCTSGLRAISRTTTRTTSGWCRHVRRRIAATCRELLARRLARTPRRRGSARAERSSSRGTIGVEHLVLRREVVVEQAVRDAGLLGDVADAARCGSPCARTRERRRRGSGAVSPPKPSRARPRRTKGSGTVARPMQRPLEGMLVVDLTRYLPGAFAIDGAAAARARGSCASSSRAATRCGTTAPGWFDALNAGKESVVCDLPGGGRVRAGAAGAGGRGSRDVPARRARHVSASDPRTCPRRPCTARSPASASAAAHEQRAGHDLNYHGWAGVLDDDRARAGRRCRSPISPRARSAR